MSNEYIKNDRQRLVEKLIYHLEKGTAPWQIPWSSQGANFLQPAYNAVTKHVYTGKNKFALILAAYEKGYNDPRWCTSVSAQKQGWNVKKGETGTPIVKFLRYDKKAKAPFDRETINGMNPEEQAKYIYKNTYVFHKIYYLYNAEQIDNIPALENSTGAQTLLKRNKRLENLIENYQCPVSFDTQADAFYDIVKDEIHLPLRQNFKSEYDLYATFLHEAAHSTGHSSRLNRFKGEAANIVFETESRAKEELRAEIASMFLGSDYMVPQTERHIEQHASYVDSWLQYLREDTNFLFDAINDAQRITDYLEDFERSLNNLNENNSFSDSAQRDSMSVDNALAENTTNEVAGQKIQAEQASETSQGAQNEQNEQEGENEAQESAKKPPKSISDTAEEEKPQNLEQKPQKTKVINLYAGPGAGKTTAALQICLELKKLGINAEYVSEFAKDLIYDGKEEMLKDQKLVTDGQYERLNRLRGKVDVIVTDSPLLLGQVYGKKSIDKDYKDEIRKRYDSFDNYNAFIVRDKNFTQKGRVHNLEESKQLDAEVLQMLSDNKIFHGYYKQGNLSEAVENIEKWLDKDKVSTIANEADAKNKNALLNKPAKEKPKKIKEKINDR